MQRSYAAILRPASNRCRSSRSRATLEPAGDANPHGRSGASGRKSEPDGPPAAPGATRSRPRFLENPEFSRKIRDFPRRGRRVAEAPGSAAKRRDLPRSRAIFRETAATSAKHPSLRGSGGIFAEAVTPSPKRPSLRALDGIYALDPRNSGQICNLSAKFSRQPLLARFSDRISPAGLRNEM